MLQELLSKHSIEFKHNNIAFPDLTLKIGDTPSIHPTQEDIYNLLQKYKNQIEKIENGKIWDFYKKLTNDFEMLHLTNKTKYQTTNMGVANYEPISRSYFKLWEMISDFGLIDFSKNKLNIVGLAEGPGGFIECMYNMRKIYTNGFYNDNCTCMTLKSYNNDVPGWKKACRLFKENQSIRVYYGEDNTGDLYRTLNIRGLARSLDEKADIVTGDGGFDFSIDYNKQEELSYRLILCQFTAGISVLKVGGNLVIKIFDVFTELTIKIIYFITSLFSKTILTKPFTSRPANSEKYLVCKDFLGISESNLENLYNIIDDWGILSNQNKQIVDLFSFDVPEEFCNLIKSYNIYVGAKQIKNILKTMSFIQLKLENSHINQIKQKQAIISSFWCKKYRVPINLKCKFLRDNVEYYNYIPNFLSFS